MDRKKSGFVYKQIYIEISERKIEIQLSKMRQFIQGEELVRQMDNIYIFQVDRLIVRERDRDRYLVEEGLIK